MYLSSIFHSTSSWRPTRNRERTKPDLQKTKGNNQSSDQVSIRITHIFYHTWCYCFPYDSLRSALLILIHFGQRWIQSLISSKLLGPWAIFNILPGPSELYEGTSTGKVGNLWASNRLAVYRSQPGTMVLKKILVHNNWEKKPRSVSQVVKAFDTTHTFKNFSWRMGPNTTQLLPHLASHHILNLSRWWDFPSLHIHSLPGCLLEGTKMACALGALQQQAPQCGLVPSLATRLQDWEAADVRLCSLGAVSGLQHGSTQEHYL